MPKGPGLGVPATEALIAGWDVSIPPDGTGLPAGLGTVSEGAQVFATKCIACHGPDGAGSVNDRLVGGQGSLTTAAPVKTIGSYWPYATTLFDYVRRAMPYPTPHSLSDPEVYALVAYLLNLNGVIPKDAVMERRRRCRRFRCRTGRGSSAPIPHDGGSRARTSLVPSGSSRSPARCWCGCSAGSRSGSGASG